ncbi:MAG: nucleoside 2-deoxyribosyltransferase [Anaerolineae bacterium]|jgi:nucleoside 2-deoxyribosyltransferase
MNIYFACSITGGREFEDIYQALVSGLLRDGHEIPTAHLADSAVMDLESIVSPQDVYERDIEWILAADALLAEVSVPSHGVGYEVGVALGAHKPVLCLYQEGRRISKMISGNPDSALDVRTYRDATGAVRLAREFVRSLLQTP